MPGISRRSFVELVLGTLGSLPVLAGGMVLAPRPARAEDDATVASQLAGKESEYVVIDVVKAWEVGFLVVDITRGQQRDGGLMYYPPVPGAEVTVTSRFNGKVAKGTTNSSGVANIDIRELAATGGDEDEDAADYHFNGTVTVEHDGWRKFQTSLIVVEGGTGLQVPAHPFDDDKTPYPYLASFDEWDALYRANDFGITPANADKHTIRATIYNLPNAGATTVELWVVGEKTPRQSAKVTAGERVEVGSKLVKEIEIDYIDAGDGQQSPAGTRSVTKVVPVYGHTATASFEAPFLKKGDGACLPVGAKLQLRVTQGGGTWTMPLAATFSEGVIDEPAGKENQQLTPINTNLTSGSALDVRWPGNVPLAGGGFLKFWMPELPINIYVNPYGLVQITIKFPSWGYRNDSDKKEPDKWTTFPRATAQQQWDKKVKTLKTMSDKTNALVSKPGRIKKIDTFKSFSLSANFQLIALAQWNADKGVFQGEMAGQLFVSANITLTENFFAGPIPVLITFALDASLIFTLGAAATSAKRNKNEKLLDAVTDLGRWQWDYVNSGFTMTFNITPSLSVGVGIRGVASISVKGAITLTLFLGVPAPGLAKGLPNPHFTAGWSAMVSLVIDLFLFTQSFALYNKKFENFYDNWEGKDKGIAAQGDEATESLADKSIEELIADLEPVTDAMLAQTSEANLMAQGMEAQSDDVSFDWGTVRTEEVMLMDDGTPLTYVSYGLVARGDNESGAAVEAEAMVAQAEETPAHQVEWLQAMADTSLPSPGIAALGSAGGIRPSSDMRIFGSDDTHVLSFARAKTVNLPSSAGTWCFRIAAVSVGGAMRTRIVGNCLVGSLKGSSWIVEFDTSKAGVKHGDLYDYDFDVTTLSRPFKEDPIIVLGPGDDAGIASQSDDDDMFRVTFAIVSGGRKEDKSGFADVATDLVFTCVSFGYNDSADFADKMRNAKQPYTMFSFSHKGSEVLGDDGMYHSLSSIRVEALDGWTEAYEQAYGYLVTFLDRRAPTAPEAIGANATPRIGLLFADEMVSSGSTNRSTVSIVGADSLAGVVGQIGDTTVYEQELIVYKSSNEGMSCSLMLRGSAKAHYVLLDFRFEVGNTKTGGPYPILRLARARRCQDYDPAIRLVGCPAQGYFLTSYPNDPAQLDLPADQRDHSKWSLHKVTWSDDDMPAMQATPAGPTGFNVVNFAVNPRGTFLFWPHTRNAGEDRVWDADGTEDVAERPAVYQIMASRIRGERFSDPFVVADLPTDTDMLAVIDVSKEAVLEALRTEYVDTGTKGKNGLPLYHAANVWYTSVPAVRCATATACEAPDPFVEPGGQIAFHVAVRNDGNTFLAGCTLTLCAYDEASDAYRRVELEDKTFASQKVTFGKDTVLESNYNPSDGKGGLLGLEDDYALPPGKSSVYAVKVTVPKSWTSGDKKVLFVASDAVVAPDTGVKAQADDDGGQAALDAAAQEFHIEPGAYRVVQTRTQPDQNLAQRHMETLTVEPDVAGGHVFQASAVAATGEGAAADTGGATTAGGTASTSGTTRSTVPNTGDGAPSGLLGAGLAAAGAAVLAYERRRAQNDRQ